MTAVLKTETSTELLAKVSPEVAAMADIFEAKFTLPTLEKGATSADLIIDKAAYAESLPEGLTIELAEQFAKHHSVMYPALGLAVGRVSTKLAAENPDLKKVVLEMPAIGKDRVVVNYDRERTFADNQAKGTITKPGQINIQHNVYATKNRGEVTKVKSFLTALAFESLSGDKK